MRIILNFCVRSLGCSISSFYACPQFFIDENQRETNLDTFKFDLEKSRFSQNSNFVNSCVTYKGRKCGKIGPKIKNFHRNFVISMRKFSFVLHRKFFGRKFKEEIVTVNSFSHFLREGVKRWYKFAHKPPKYSGKNFFRGVGSRM